MASDIEHVEVTADAHEINNTPPCFKSFINSDNEAYHSPKGTMASFEEIIAKQKKILEFWEGTVEEQKIDTKK